MFAYVLFLQDIFVCSHTQTRILYTLQINNYRNIYERITRIPTTTTITYIYGIFLKKVLFIWFRHRKSVQSRKQKKAIQRAMLTFKSCYLHLTEILNNFIKMCKHQKMYST